jgi:hypothetical protein
MKYLLDFDRTVFDMEGLYQAIETYNPDAELGTVASLQGIDLQQFLFNDALEFFATHDQLDIDIVSSGFGLTGQWEVAYQIKKIELSGVGSYVRTVHVVPDSKISTIKRLARELEEVVYVDDHPEHVASAVQHIPGLCVVHIDRSGTQPDIPGSFSITKLTDIDHELSR